MTKKEYEIISEAIDQATNQISKSFDNLNDSLKSLEIHLGSVDGLSGEEERLAVKAIEEESCLDCHGTGLADNYRKEGEEWVLEGTKPCLCQIPHVEPEELNEVTL